MAMVTADEQVGVGDKHRVAGFAVDRERLRGVGLGVGLLSKLEAYVGEVREDAWSQQE